MPQFFFHVCLGDTHIPDDEGSELDDLAAAQCVAVESARELAADRLRFGEPLKNLAVEIADEAGAKVHIVRARDLAEA